MGLAAATTVELGRGVCVRPSAAGELAHHWPEAGGLLPPAFGREPDGLLVAELERALDRGAADVPDGPGELADAVTAIRLATAGAVAVGPVVFERLDWRPYGIRPAVPIAATEPTGEPTRLDQFRGRLAAELLSHLELADEDPELGEALDRSELSLFQAEPFRSEQLREALAAVLGGPDGTWAAAVRGGLLLGAGADEREQLFASLRALAAGDEADVAAADAVRRLLVEALLHGDRAGLLATVDEALVELRPPSGYYARLADARAQSRHERVRLVRAADD